MQLREKEKDMLDGKYGPGHQRCMEILVAVGECYGSERMVPKTHRGLALTACCPTPSIAVFGLEGVPERSTSEQREYLSDRMG